MQRIERRLLALARPHRALLALGLTTTTIASLLDGITIVTLIPLLKHLFGTAGELRTGATSLERWATAMTRPLLEGTTPPGVANAHA